MRDLPHLPESNPEFGALYAVINRIIDEVRSLRPRTSHKQLTTHGATGVLRQPLVSIAEEGEEGRPVWLP